MAFRNRIDAGQQLAKRLEPYAKEDCIVLGMPRGGVVLAAEVAKHLNKPMDIMTVRKLGAPGHAELAIGAIGPGDVLVLNQYLITTLNVSQDALERILNREKSELSRRLHYFRGNRPFPSLYGKTVILVDDGLATGASARAAVEATKALGANRIILAVPVGAHSAISNLRGDVDELVCLEAPEYFDAVSHWYGEFSQVEDCEVIELLEKAWGNNLGDTTVKSKTIGPF